MPIPFTCPHCGHQTTVSDEFAGQSGPCSQCGQTVIVPAPAPGAGGPYLAPAKSSATPLVVLIVVAVVAIPVLIACTGILIALLLPAVQAAREAARRATCINHLKQIGLAMHTYHDEFGCFPPAYIPDENGRPKHSWRVLILPYLEQRALYDRYDFDQPWDSPQNRALASRMPQVYRCPTEVGDGGTETSYLMVVGPGTISDGPTAHRLRDIRDGPSNTVMVVEAAHSNVNWMQPEDVDAATVGFGIKNPLDEGIQSDHPGGANVLFCDGSVRFLSKDVDTQVLDGLITISGGEVFRIP